MVLGFSRRRSFLHFDDQFSCCHWSLKKHKRGCLYLVVNLRKNESMDLELARGCASKFYWWVAIKSRVWGLVSLIVWTSILSKYWIEVYLEDSYIKFSLGFYRFGFLGDHIFMLFIFQLLYWYNCLIVIT